MLFRGQSNNDWPLSTFLRDSIERLFGIGAYQDLPKSIKHRVSFHRVIASLLLLKFGTIWKPSNEALSKEKIFGIDPWYELLKNVQLSQPLKDELKKYLAFKGITEDFVYPHSAKEENAQQGNSCVKCVKWGRCLFVQQKPFTINN